MKRIITISNLVIFLSATLVYAEPYPQYVRHDAEDEIVDRTVQELRLSPEQQEQIYQQRRQYQKEQEELKSRYDERRRSLREELDSPRADSRRVENVSGEIKDIEGRMFDNRVKNLMKMKEILTPEQFETFSEGGGRLRRTGEGVRNRRGE